MSKINAQWHLARVMPKNPTDKQRAEWHSNMPSTAAAAPSRRRSPNC